MGFVHFLCVAMRLQAFGPALATTWTGDNPRSTNFVVCVVSGVVKGRGNAQNGVGSNHQSQPRTQPHTGSLELALDVRLELVGPLPGVLSPSFPSHMSSRSRS